ncbi:hypothetical protein ABT072_40025 [Streptomyces sp. NPDC002589]|uniref:hypothetical protein n=1 Tax=Streptomyces sp. NPDC002589 TaxID=3154420 RepID=UPI00333151AF
MVAASAHENTVGIALLDQVAEQSGTVKKALVDQGFKKKVVEHGKNVDIDVETSATRTTRASFRRPSGGSWTKRDPDVLVARLASLAG